MPVHVAPKFPKSSHHLALIDSQGRKLGLITCNARGKPSKFGLNRSRLQSTSLKISEGNPKYSDFELPFTPIVQETWEGGRGQEQFERDVSKFLDSYRANTVFPTKITAGPLESICTGYRKQDFMLPGSVRWVKLVPGTRAYIAKQFIAAAAYTAAYVEVILKRRGSPGTFTVTVCQDSSDNPGTAIEAETLIATARPDIIGQTERWSLASTTYTLGTKYWIKVTAAATDTEDNCWLVAVKDASGSSKESANGSSWSSSGVDLYYRTYEGSPYAWRPLFYEYKGAEYFITRRDDLGAPQIFMNGDRGAADSNSADLTKLNDGTKAWATDQYKGCVVWITEGPGALEDPPFRAITGNAANALTCSPAWVVTHTTSTEYVILGADSFVELTGHGMTVAPTDVLVINNIVYYALGNATNIKRHREYNNAGTWTATDWADEGTSKADLLAKVQDKTAGLIIWRALNDTVQISKATATSTWGTALSFGTGIQVGDTEEKIADIREYIDPDSGEKILWAFKTGSVYAIKTDKPDKIPLDEMRAVMSFNNSRATLTHNVYVYFTLLQSLERYFNGVLDDVGPTSGRGLPANRKGPIVDLAGYPGRYYAAVDAGLLGYSSILCNNGTGWHEIYRSVTLGARIRSIKFQVVHGTLPDRLYFNEAQQIKYLPFPSETTDPTQDSAYPFTWESTVESSRLYAGMQDVNKLFDSIKVSADNLVEDVTWIELDYKVDDENNAWTTLPYPFILSPSQEEPLSEAVSLTGRWLMYRVRILTSNAYKTPQIRAMMVNCLSRVAIRYGWAPTVRLKDNDVDLNGVPDDLVTAEEKIALLDEWSESLEALTLESVFGPFHNQRVFLEGPNLGPYVDTDEGEKPTEGFIATIPMTQVLTAAMKKNVT